MFLKLIDSLAFLSIIVSATASLLALCTFTYLGSKIPYDIIALIFSGTLSIYNIDHLRGLKSDSGTNPLRTVFIRKYLLNIKIIIVISLIFSLFLGFKTGLLELYWLLPAIFLGLLHRRIKNNNLFSGIYITISWLIVTVIFPASIHGKLSQIFLPSLIIGTALFSNAYISSSKDKPNHLHKAKISLIIATL
ncbi:MAG: hypothetical protein GTO02_13210, partial [Candidatus Dadabacteria bacterium]|nr:hypothetical protein [Candidatus Dadabacteria bacterium]NIQ15306.1 hypothetical protein [Candidatus Dadabacteria bacterium]